MLNIKGMGCDCAHNSDFVHDRPGFEDYLMIFVKTKAVFFIGDEERYTEPGTFIIYNYGSPRHYKAFQDQKYVNDWAVFELSERLALPDTVFDKPVHIGDTVDVSSYFRLIADCHYRSRNPEIAEHIIRALITDVFSELENETNTTAHYRELLDLRRRIYASPGNNWTVAVMSAEVSMCRSYLFTLYKKAFGISCTEDLIKARIERAKHDLIYSDDTLPEIAENCGYNNNEHFSRQFKKITGVSPGQWRKTMREH